MKRFFITAIAMTLGHFLYAQSRGWQHLDPQMDSVFGISTTRAYNELLKGKKSKTVIVAIVDAGIDTLQEDLKNAIWTDPKTGHHGWNYIGPETGQEDVTKLAGYNKDLYDSLAYAGVPEQYRAAYQAYRKETTALESKIDAMKKLQAELETIETLTDQILVKMGKTNPTTADFKNYQAPEVTEQDKMAYSFGTLNEKYLVMSILKRLDFYPNWQAYRYHEIDHIQAMVKYHLAHGLNVNNHEADTARGNFDIAPDKLGPVSYPNIGGAYHGTHVAGIIGAIRGNGVGIDGVADNVQILMLKENGTLREMRDDALARAIRFAVDHGAKVINLSFGKSYTWDKKAVDEAVRYAMKKDVLLVHAAGNDGDNIDNEEHYPNPVFLDHTKANNWLEVGASGPKNDSTICSFLHGGGSNYGKRDVDVFAPGVAIYSTLPYNQYQSWDGTSMATPMVAGLAALIREYYPKLTAVQVREIIITSVIKTPYLSDKCSSGGVINAYNALKLAETYKKKSDFTFSSEMTTGK